MNMPSSRVVGYFAATVACATSLIFAFRADAASTLTVPVPYPTIQAAVTAASSGDTIIVAAGTYIENVTITKSLIMKGAQAGVDARGRIASETIVITPSPTVPPTPQFLVAFNGSITIDGFEFSGGPTGSNGAIFTSVGPNNDMQIINNRFIGYPAAAVWMNRGGSNITIDKNVMDGSSLAGGGQAIFCNGPQSFAGLNVTNNWIINNPGRYGIFVDGNHNVGESATRAPSISGNIFNNNLQAMNLGSRSFGTLAAPVLGPYGGYITNNTISNHSANGIQAGIQHVIVSGNTFSNNAIAGLALTSFGNPAADRGAQFCNITNNQFSNNGAGTGGGVVCSATQAPTSISTNHINNNFFTGNYRGASYSGGEVIDMENNWWGNNSGPTDLSGTNPVSGCTSGFPYVGNLVNASGSGDQVLDNGIDYCPFLSLPTLTLSANSSCYDVNDTVVVNINVSGLSVPAVGGQFFLNFDQAKLQLLGAVPGDPGTGVGPPSNPTNPFEVEVYECAGQTVLGVCVPTNGRLDYAVGVPGGGPGSGSAANNTMAVIRFKALAEVCNTANLVRFRDNVSGPLIPPTRLTDEFGGAIGFSPATLNDLGPITIDSTSPILTCPPTATIQCPTPPTPANTGTATATDNCSTPTVTYGDSTSTLVTPSMLGGWSLFATTAGTNTPGGDGVANFVNGPATPPLGVGSAHLNTGTDGEQSAQLRNSSWAGTRIDALTSLGYSTYATAWNGQQVPYLTIYLDTDGDNVRDDRLWFEPDFSSAGAGNGNPNPQPAAALNVWQTWDALGGMWYSDSGVGTPGSGAVTLATYLAAKPNATIINEGAGGIRIASGFGSTSDVFNAYVDAFTISTASSYSQYNFELSAPTCGDHVITRTWTATDACGNQSQCTQTINVIDTTPPAFTNVCPLPTINVNSDAGLCEASFASVNPTTPTATDTCSSPVVTFVRSDNKLNLTDPYEAADSPIVITWTATDACNNQIQCTQTVNVSSNNELLLTVQLQPNIAPTGNLTRCITLDLWRCTPNVVTTVSAPITFTVSPNLPDPNIALAASAVVLVPCGNYTCITARDRLHTLRRTDEGFGIVGTKYVADFTGDPSSGGDWLIGGNLNDDQYIDILDFGTFVSQSGVNYGSGNTTCSTPYPHADVSGDGTVGTPDFTFIQINFLKFHEANCCGAALRMAAGGGAAPTDGSDGGPVTRISVKELLRRGFVEAISGDINHDQWLDSLDVQQFMAGGVPATTGNHR